MAPQAPKISTDLRRDEWLAWVRFTAGQRAWPVDLVEDLVDELEELPWSEIGAVTRLNPTAVSIARFARADTLKKAAHVVARVAPDQPGADKVITFFAERARIEDSSDAEDWEHSLVGGLLTAGADVAVDLGAGSRKALEGVGAAIDVGKVVAKGAGKYPRAFLALGALLAAGIGWRLLKP